MQMNDLCEKLNKLIPCKTEEDRDKLKKMITEELLTKGGSLYWNKNFFVDCKCNEGKMKEVLIQDGTVEFSPCENQEKYPGIIVGYKKS